MADSDINANKPGNQSFEKSYPQISRWVKDYGWIEVGQVPMLSTFILALDDGGIVWEGKESYKSLDEAFRAAEKGLSDRLEEIDESEQRAAARGRRKRSAGRPRA